MSKKPSPLKFESFEEFYINRFANFKKEHPNFLRLDGRTKGSNRSPYAYFNYDGKCWKIDADTWFEKLEKAYKHIQNNQDPFEVKQTRNNKNFCLVIKDETDKAKKFYVYLTGLSIK